jgi:phenylacetate-CoA ligase
VAVRAVDQNGAGVGPGEPGEIVISNLVNRATVLLNYKLGDVVTLGESPCPCGRTLPTIQRLAGRVDDLIALPRGQKVHSLTLLSGLQAVPGVVQVQVAQEELRRFLLLAVCTGETDWDQARRDLGTAMRSVLGDDIALEARRVEAIPPGRSGKVRAVISRCAG